MFFSLSDFSINVFIIYTYFTHIASSAIKNWVTHNIKYRQMIGLFNCFFLLKLS